MRTAKTLKIDSPFAGGTTWDVVDRTVIGALAPSMISTLRRGSEDFLWFAERRIAGHQLGRPGRWDHPVERELLGWRSRLAFELDPPVVIPEIDLKLSHWVRNTHEEFLRRLPATGGVVQLESVRDVDAWLHTLIDHYKAVKAAGEEQLDPDARATLMAWFRNTFFKIRRAADRVGLTRVRP
ncbi:hypothetical protein GCM10017786_35170 [Amycolatopsis deserti]|uniref:Uncharacterized protein n=1 Tax=Amycolatopsis deserti TaxID=185696 RepID=A0ABQ3IZD0_9PSEU|nr:hypothetical protein [Amycolatopsis deserti]GHE99028.1 hypothetical protein GCM10017786_35170 [Amycolatopsis deserti]